MAKDDAILPVPGRYLTATLKQQYQNAISQIIADMGREVTLHLPPTESGCPNCKFISMGGRSQNVYNASNPFPAGPYNRQFPNGVRCSVCNGEHVIKTVKTAIWRATVVKRPEDYEYTEGGPLPENVALTKFRTEAWDDVCNCVRATIDGLDYDRLSEPYKRGMGNEADDLKFVECFWKRVT